MFPTFVQVALGGAIGASARWILVQTVARLAGPGFPLGVLTANVLGSLIMGAFVIVAAQRSLTHLSPLVMTGLLGGFTTFSSFSLETVRLFEAGDAARGTLYVVLSVGVSVGALVLGMALARAAFA